MNKSGYREELQQKLNPFSSSPTISPLVITVGVIVLRTEREWWTGSTVKAGTEDVAMIVGRNFLSETFALS